MCGHNSVDIITPGIRREIRIVSSAQDWDELTGLGCMMFSTVMKNIGVAHAESLVIKYFTSSAYISTHHISTFPTVHFTFLG